MVQLASGETDFAENAWVGHTLAIGAGGPPAHHRSVRAVRDDHPRAGGSRADPGILRTAAQHNQVNVGVYAAVVQGGTIRRGDPVWMA